MIRSEPNYVALAEAWEELDDQLDALQSAKRNIVSSLREEHGKVVADAFKAAMRIRRMDGEKRMQAEAVDAEAFRILGILAKGRAPRATREIIEKFDAETGEIIPHQQPPSSQVVDEPEAGPPPPASGSPIPLILKTAKDWRPNCLNPECCAASGLDHCYRCRKALGEAAA